MASARRQDMIRVNWIDLGAISDIPAWETFQKVAYMIHRSPARNREDERRSLQAYYRSRIAT